MPAPASESSSVPAPASESVKPSEAVKVALREVSQSTSVPVSVKSVPVKSKPVMSSLDNPVFMSVQVTQEVSMPTTSCPGRRKGRRSRARRARTLCSETPHILTLDDLTSPAAPVMAMEAGSEQYVFPAMVTDVSPELPPLSVTFTHVRPEQSTPDTTMETTPKQPTIPVRSMEAILKPSAPTGTEYAFALEPPESARAPDQSLVLALGLESASSQFNPKSVSESASVPVQEFIPEDPVPAATEGSQASASVIQESVPESVPVAPEGSSEVPEGVPETVFEPVPALESSLAAPEGSQEPVSGSIFIAPEGSLSASRGSQELVPEPIPAAQEGISSGPNDCPESIFELGPEAPKGIPVIAPEPTPDSAPATEAVLVSFVTSLEANPESLVSHVKPTESNLISHAVPSKTVPVPAKEVLPESPELLIEATSESLASHVLPTKNILEFAHNAKFSRRPSPVK